jgi:hypothetical protein
MWVEIRPGRLWSTWVSCHDSGRVIGGSGVTFTGTLTDDRVVARTFDGREFVAL